MSKHHTPLAVCEALIGKPEVIADICAVNEKAPYGWRHASLRRDAGDLPYDSHKRALLAYAAARCIPLTAEHLIWGASEDELAALIAAAPVQPAFSSRREAAE